MKAKATFIILALLAVLGIAGVSLVWPPIWWAMILVGPLVLLGISDMMQTNQAVRRNFPVIGNLRYFFESIRPEIMQYFVETDMEGRPFNRINRSLVYQRAKNVTDTTPFGTQMDVYSEGYEWMEHSIFAKDHHENTDALRVKVGGKDCKQPYEASLLNISAMSYGSLSKNAVQALNGGAKLGGFAHNTGEGGISAHHLSPGGDLIWQIGTGYFGCRTKDGKFDSEKFQKSAQQSNVKMIEIKLSQGAKPGHGGILPGVKNTEEIAAIRGVEPHTTVHSPPSHSAFNDANGLMQFVGQLRDLSGGKPVGFKLCVGRPEEFTTLCNAMQETGIRPDFITIDGGEGGTGAAPVEFSNSLGMPLRDALAMARNSLMEHSLKDEIRLIAAGRIVTGFDMVRAFALGADICYSARAMMLALGCIQALQCNKNSCPVGVATQDKTLMNGLVVSDKRVRVANFHRETLNSMTELVAAAGLNTPADLDRSHINRRISLTKVSRYSDIYPYPAA